MSRVYIILVNWNGWRDTIECLESIYRSDYPDYRVLVSDNGSTDNSLTYIKAWADGQLDAYPGNDVLRNLSSPPVSKPIPYCECNKEELEQKGACEEADASLVLLCSNVNMGFAGGNNVGLRYALARDDFDFVWLLNNDTVISSDALSHLVARMKEEPRWAGMCGSTIYFYEEPDRVQALGGGHHCKWIGLPWHYGRFSRVSRPYNRERTEARMNYVEGASLLASKQFLQDIGFMCEDYFLYFEETDWAVRAKSRYTLAYAPESIVYHKVGGSIGTSSDPKKKSYLCDYYNIRNRLFFTRRYYPYALPGIYLVLLVTLVLRILLGKWDRVTMILRLLINYSQVNIVYPKDGTIYHNK